MQVMRYLQHLESVANPNKASRELVASKLAMEMNGGY
jgi:hypothetical protein